EGSLRAGCSGFRRFAARSGGDQWRTGSRWPSRAWGFESRLVLLPSAIDPLLTGLRIVEIHYNPPGGIPHEFVELRNVSSSALSLAGVRFTDGIEYTFPEYELGPGERVLVVADLFAFAEHHGPGLPVLGPFTGRLANGGETLALSLPSPSSLAIQRFRYEDSWFPESDGGGYALEATHPLNGNELWDQREGWKPGSRVGGSPGAMVLRSEFSAPAILPFPEQASLTAAATDEGLPTWPYPATFTWSLSGGPGTVRFSAETESTTGAIFSNAGRYTLLLQIRSNGQEDRVEIPVAVQSDYLSWAQPNFSDSEQQDADISGPSADPDGDGWSNLLEYALDLDPRTREASIPGIDIHDDGKILTHTRTAGRKDLVFEVETATDLNDWSLSDRVLQTVAEERTEAGHTRIRSRIRTSAARRFFRLKVSQR
ncbi:MAG: lamin tail domain-containing protein, partial [Verrucomicrobiota bacterium]